MDIIHVKKDEIDGHKSGFIALYQKAFSEAPYFEVFTEEEAFGVLEELVVSNGGVCLVSVIDGETVGFCGGYDLSVNKDLIELVSGTDNKPINGSTFYIAELAVAGEYRYQGIGTTLVRNCLDVIRMTNNYDLALMRTQAEGSNSQRLFERLNFRVVPGLLQEVKTIVSDNGNKMLAVQKRHFLARKP